MHYTLIERKVSTVQFRRQANQEEHINLTPLIDVVFLLLIFFMVSTTFTKETHLEIDLPEASLEPASTQEINGIDIAIRASGDYSVNGQPLVNQQAITLQRGIESLLDTLSKEANELPLTITADANTPHQAVVRAMDIAGQLGFAQLRITTRQPTQEN